MTTGQFIKEQRLRKGFTQDDLAAKTDLTARTIQRIENNDVVPRSYTLQSIAQALDVDFDSLKNIQSLRGQMCKHCGPTLHWPVLKSVRPVV